MFPILIILLTLISACGQKPDQEHTTVQIVLPGKYHSKVEGEPYPLPPFSTKGGTWGVTNPTKYSDIGCYLIMYNGPEPINRQSFCTMKDGSAGFSVGMMLGGFRPGQTVSFTVPAGPDREFILIGFAASSESGCFNFKNTPLNQELLSAPFVLGKTKVNLNPGNSQTVSLTASFNASAGVNQCQGPEFGDRYAQGDRPIGSTNFGDGSDGDYTLNGMTTYLASATGARGVPLISTSRVSQIFVPDANQPKIILVNLYDNWNSKIVPGDKVLLHVPSSYRGSTMVMSKTNTGGSISQIKAVDFPLSSPSSMMAVPSTSRFVFAATTTNAGKELWASDGTAAGTLLIKDIRSGTTSSSPVGFRAALGKVFFWADDGVNGKELWVTDGTAAGTALVKDIKSGAGDSYPGFDSMIVEFSSKAYFYADGANGVEVHMTDGTTANTSELINVNTSSDQGHLEEYNWIGTNGSFLFFVLRTNVSSMRLWKSTGAASNASEYSPTYSNAKNFLTDNSKLFFLSLGQSSEGYEPHMINGTSTPSLVKDVNPGSGWGSFDRPVTLSTSSVLFYADDGTNGSELWKTDGTSTGSAMVKNISSSGGSSDGQHMVKVTASGTPTIVFTANDVVVGTELWKSDGTSTGTAIIKDIYTGSSSSSPKNLTVMGNEVYFWAQDSQGYQLYKTDTTSGGTVKLTNYTTEYPTGVENPPLAIGSDVYVGLNIADSGETCGINIGKGFRTEGVVNHLVSGTQLNVTVGDQSFGNIQPANLGKAARATPPLSFCRLNIIRIPQFASLTLNAGSNINLYTGDGYDHEASGAATHGGYMKFKVRDTLIVQGGVNKISASFNGFKGGETSKYHGQGTEGAWEATSKRIGNGGGSSGSCGSGGGHGGVGQGSYAGVAIGGSGTDCNNGDPTLRCLLGPIFMGGGGGSTWSKRGGHGGGIVELEARTLRVDAGANLIVESNGESGLSDTSGPHGSGGGAGGSILMKIDEVINNGQIYLSAKGGAAGDTACSAGAGGGGRIHVDVFFKHTGSAMVPYVTGGSGAALGTCLAVKSASLTCP